MKEPNFFVIGAPKCGTTSLARWLAQHPDVFMSSVKEPHHFSTDFSLGDFNDNESYYALFENADDHHAAVGEASATYLRSKVAVSKIRSRHPKALFIVMLRNPVDMAPSLHWQAVFSGDEDVENFEQAWRLNSEREAEREIPPNCRDPKVFQYRLFCSLGEQLARLYEMVGRERVLTIFLEDIETDVRREWARILAFLDVSYWDDLEFHAQNRAKHWRWPWVRDLQSLYAHTRKQFKLPPLGWGVFGRLQEVAVREAKREPVSAELRRELVETFSNDIDLLAALTGRDLEHWKTT
jgi:hypothetical protein